ncbi:MAG: hypothetical protein WAW88_09500 [Nocardioides sp.]
MTASQWRILGLASIGLPALLLTACSGQTSNPLFAAEVVEAPASAWASTGLPYGGLEDQGKTWRLSFRGYSVSLPATDPTWTKAANLQSGDETPKLELSTAGATSDSGIFQLTPPGGQSQVWELTSEGEWRKIGAGVTQIALADVTGHLVTWVEGVADDAKKGKESKVVAYDTESGEIVGSLEGREVQGSFIRVMAVNANSIVVQGVEDFEGSRWSRNYLWNPQSLELTEFTDAEPEDVVTVTDYDEKSGSRIVLSFSRPSWLAGPEGSVEIGGFGFGQFNSDATQVITEGFGLAKLLDTRTNTPIKLDIPISDQDSFVPGAFAWTADDRLAVIGAIADEQQQAYICTPGTGTCEELGTEYLWFSSKENAALGQFAYHDEPEGD